MQVRTIKETEILATMKLSSICFDYPYENKGKTEEELLKEVLADPDSKAYAYWEKQLAVFDDNEDFMACMAVVPFQFYFDGGAYTGNGIGNVCTYPHHRKKGAIRAMFQKMLTDAYAENQMFSYLYPFSESFYGKFGYQRMGNSKRYTFKLQGIPDFSYSGKFQLLVEGNKELFEKFQAAYAAFASTCNMMVKRDSHDWDNVRKAKAHINNQYAYLYTDENGEPAGYIVFQRAGQTLNCRELVFRDYDTLKAIFGFMKGYASDYQDIKFHAPAALHLEEFCKDFCAYQPKIEQAMNGMIRVIQVEQALKNANYRGSGTVKIQIIEDSYIPQNNGLFSVTFQENKATEVVHLCEEQTEEFDICMPISVFSAAIVGNYSMEDFAWIEKVTVPNLEKVEILQKVFYRKKSFINNFF